MTRRRKILGWLFLAAALGAVALAGCGGSGPPAQDVQACHMAVTSLDKQPIADPLDYMVASAVAVSPDLKQALTGMFDGLSTLSAPGVMGSVSDNLANDSIRAAGAICTGDGVAWPAGDS